MDIQDLSMDRVPPSPNTSPRWSSNAKLLVGLVMVGIVAFLLVRFQSLIPLF